VNDLMSNPNDPLGSGKTVPTAGIGDTGRYYNKEFWSKENLNYSRPHFRLEKAARILNKLAAGKERVLLDVGCGPATLMYLLEPNIEYNGIDIAIQEPAPNLLEADLLKSPITFAGKQPDIVLAQGFFEYAGQLQSQKFEEIAELLKDDGVFLVSYVNFGHWHKDIYWPYSNVQPLAHFRKDLARFFGIHSYFPTSHNLRHREPRSGLLKAVNMSLSINVPVLSPLFAVEYFFICTSLRDVNRGRGGG
jgi:SAM-dependent methyltransferase